jgi:hypothetical protein
VCQYQNNHCIFLILSGLQLFLEGIGLEGVSVLISELFSIDVFGWELDKSKFVSELLMSLFTFMDSTIVVSIGQYCLQLTDMKSGITTSKKLRESIGNSLSKTVEEQVKSDLDEHIKTLRETIKKKQETITEQKSFT